MKLRFGRFCAPLLFSVFCLSLLCAHPLEAAKTGQVILVHDRELPLPAATALRELTKSLQSRDFQVSENSTYETAKGHHILIGLATESPLIKKILEERKLAVTEKAESVFIARFDDESSDTILLSSHDARGLSYAIWEVNEAIRLAPDQANPFDAIHEANESPLLKTRSITTQLFNRDVEKDWYGDEEYWKWFFGMLARNRFNQYTLTFGHNTNYMVPPYPWLFEVPGFPDVQVEGLSDEDRKKNFLHFRRITELAKEYGIDLNIGLWTQLPVVKARVGLDYGSSPVRNLPIGMQGGKYCAEGLKKLLNECPEITGVQLRMNLESGIPHEQQEEYYRIQFKAIADAIHPVKIDLRYKSLSQKTIDLANQAGLDVTVSTKHWCEHMGLPFHPTWQDPAYSQSRYGYGQMLHYPRNYRVIFRLWSVGTSRLLLWGNPEYASRFARNCTMGDGEGFEIFSPLSNKGYGNEPGNWRIFTNKDLEYYQWEYQRYWAWYLSFGRFGYNPDTPDYVWERELVSRFGKAWKQMDQAYREASQVLPFLTATTQFSAGNWRFWPEFLPCMHLDAYRAIQPGDYSQFYAIAPFSSRQHWRAEGWAATHSAFVEDVLNENLNSKWTPMEVSQRLNHLAEEIEQNLSDAEESFHSSDEMLNREFQATQIDFRILASLARYHAAKKTAAVHLEFFRLTNDKSRLPVVLKYVKQSLDQWKNIVSLTDGKYYDRMVFGFTEDHHSDFPDRLQVHAGHWKDQLASVEEDVAFVETLLKNNEVDPNQDLKKAEEKLKRFPGEIPLNSKPVIQHGRLEEVTPGQPIAISAEVESDSALRDVSVYFRVMDQTRSWKRITMKQESNQFFSATILGNEIDPRFDFQYYLEARVATGGTFWPDWQKETPYVQVKIKR